MSAPSPLYGPAYRRQLWAPPTTDEDRYAAFIDALDRDDPDAWAELGRYDPDDESVLDDSPRPAWAHDPADYPPEPDPSDPGPTEQENH